MMIRVIIAKEDEKGKKIFLFGGDDSTSCLEDVMKIATGEETFMTHCKDENELFNKLAMIK